MCLTQAPTDILPLPTFECGSAKAKHNNNNTAQCVCLSFNKRVFLILRPEFYVKPLISKPHKTEVLVTSNDVDVNDLSQKGGGFKTSLKVGGITGVEALGAGLPGLWVSG